MKSTTSWFRLGALSLALLVCISAFGAHALKEVLTPYGRMIFDRATFYHSLHGCGIILCALGASAGLISQRKMELANTFFLLGILLFSGSLYTLAITDVKLLGMITPFGGVSFIVGWLIVARGECCCSCKCEHNNDNSKC